MKSARILLAAVCLAALLCGCSREAKMVGTWVSSGAADVGGGLDFARATQWTFTEEGTVTVVLDGEAEEYRYSMSDDTLTLNGEEISYGMRYELKGDTFSLHTGSGRADFERMED